MASSFSSNDAVSDYIQHLYDFDQVRDITASVFTDNRDVIEAVFNDNNIDGELLSKNDFVTMENELADDEGRRVSSMHTTTLAVKNSIMTSPLFVPETGELENAMVVQGNVPVSMYLDQTTANLGADIQAALAKQLRFGLDSAAGVMKNCIAAHNVIHSLLLSALMYFRAKIVESRSSLADNEEGKVMAICRIADTLAEISSLVQEAKKVSYNFADKGEAKNGEGKRGASSVVVGEKYIDLTRAKLPAKCNFCNVAGHGPTPIVGQFLERLQEEYIKRNDDMVKEKRSAVQKGGLSDIFITRSSGAPQANNNIASKAASAAIQHNYAVNTGERSSIECAFKRAKFDSQVGHLMQSYTDSRIRQLEYHQQQQQQQQQQQETPGQTCAITEERERRDECRYEVERDSEAAKDNGERINLPEENRGEQPNFRVVQGIDAKAPQSLVQNVIMQQLQDQLAPPQLKTTAAAAAAAESAVPADYTELTRPRPPLPLVSPILSPAPQRQEVPAAAAAAAAESVVPADYTELTRPRPPLPLVSPILSPAPQRQEVPAAAAAAESAVPALPPDYIEKMKLPPLLSPIRSPSATTLVGSVLEPSQSETERVASEIRRLEMLGYSPSLPAIRGRDRQNRASMGAAVKKFGPRRKYK